MFEVEIEDLIRDAVERAIGMSDVAPQTENPAALFYSPRARALKDEIVHTGRKLWQRAYVDGNGGNISARLSENLILCTPTLISKGDLTPADICLVDLENTLLCGEGRQTSEIRLHLEIYNAVPHARAVVHCHPVYATAHAIAGVTPPQHLLPEQEVFVGPVEISPYDTPGTSRFAQSILPFVETHPVILLANHGVVSWSDTVTHAEWAVEVVEAYCQTAHLARQLNPNFSAIPPEKIADLLSVKRQIGIPDPRFAEQPQPRNGTQKARPASVDELVQSITQQILSHAAGRG